MLEKINTLYLDNPVSKEINSEHISLVFASEFLTHCVFYFFGLDPRPTLSNKIC